MHHRASHNNPSTSDTSAVVLHQLQQHRSIRTFRTDAEIPESDIRTAVACGQRASSSSNIQAYSLIRIRNHDHRERLIALTGGQDKVAECGAFFIVCGDLRRHMLMARRAGEPFDVSLEAFLIAVVDASLFAQNVCIAFESMGYGICYIGGLRNELPEVDRMLNLPEGVLPIYGLCVGVPAEEPIQRPRLNVDAVLHDDAYPTDKEMLAHIDEYDERARTYYRERTGAGPARDWSTANATRFAKPSRTHLANYYRTKGASLD